MVERAHRFGLDFEWDAAKAISNLAKHGVSFDEAMSSFADPLAMIVHDVLHSDREDRWSHIGKASTGRLLVTTYTHRDRWLRIIGSRTATERERHDFEEAGPRRGRHP